MRRSLWILLALATACAAPLPCTRALCPGRLDGSYRVTGWNRSVTVSSGTPATPIVSDSTVDVMGGPVQFTNDQSVLTAAPGTTFSFEVSTHAVPSITVTSGSVTVSTAPAAPAQTVPLGAPYALPVAP